MKGYFYQLLFLFLYLLAINSQVQQIYGENDIDQTRFVEFLEDCKNECEENRQRCSRSCQFTSQDSFECQTECKNQLNPCLDSCEIKLDDYKMDDLSCHEYMIICLQDTCKSYDSLAIKKCMAECEDKKAICLERKAQKEEL